MNGKSDKNELLAVFLTENIEKNEIISEIFRMFNINCIDRCTRDPGVLDDLIHKFNKSQICDISVLSEIIKLIKEEQIDARNRKDTLLRRIQSYIDETFARDLSVEEIAAHLHISYHYMCHLFKEKCQMSITTFRNRKRLDKGMKMLLQTNEKISDVAIACGFNTSSYFAEIFTKNTGISPAKFRNDFDGLALHDFYDFEDIMFATKLSQERFISDKIKRVDADIEEICITEPDENYHFLHETAIIEYHGVIYASWYACREHELSGYTPICGRRSYDKGKTWTQTEVICADETSKIMYCPPVYGICDDKLYMLVNQMVAPDHIHSLDLYVLNTQTDKFDFLWSRPIPFKLNTNVVMLPNGKLMLCGRIAKLDGFPNTPAVLISDSGKIDDEWRLVKIAKNGDLPGGTSLSHAEISCIMSNDRVYMFCRNDRKKVPLVYVSDDCGESWSDVQSHDIPYVDSKIYCGNLSDGRCYLVGNTDKPNRSKLSLFLTENASPCFTKRIDILDVNTDTWGAIHYPSVCEYDGYLYIIATKSYNEDENQRGAELFRINLKTI